MSFKTFATLALSLFSVVHALPSVSRQDDAYLSGLLDFLENTNPDDLVLSGPLADESFTAHNLFDPEWRVSHGLADPRTSSANPLRARAMELEKRYTCVYTTQAILNGAYCCHDYLASLGSRSCVVSGLLTDTTFVGCSYNGHSAKAYGWPTYPLSYASSLCTDVAIGLQPIFDNCHTSCNDGANCYVSGINTANGNGDLSIAISA